MRNAPEWNNPLRRSALLHCQRLHWSASKTQNATPEFLIYVILIFSLWSSADYFQKLFLPSFSLFVSFFGSLFAFLTDSLSFAKYIMYE